MQLHSLFLVRYLFSLHLKGEAVMGKQDHLICEDNSLKSFFKEEAHIVF